MYSKITFVELVDLLAEATATSKRVCELFLRELFSTASQALINGENVKIKGIGTFKVTQVKPRKSVNVSTGDAIEIQGHSKLTFTPDRTLAEAVNTPFAQFETVYLDDAVTDEKLAEIDEQFPSVDVPLEPAGTPVPQAEQPAPVEEAPVPVAVEEEPASVAVEEAPAPVAPAMAIGIDGPSASTPIEPVPASAQTELPPLVGTPIDGPTQEPEPASTPEPQGDEQFCRPETKNAYSPTPEQIDSMLKKRPAAFGRRWLWGLLALVLAGGVVWMATRCGTGKTEQPVEPAPVPRADTTAIRPEVVTDTVTTTMVPCLMAEKHYGYQLFWVYIYEENKDKFIDYGRVPLGTVLVIPPAEKYGIDKDDPESVRKAGLISLELSKKSKASSASHNTSKSKKRRRRR